MDYENSVYLGMLISGLGVGPIFHKIKKPWKKKWFATIFGFGTCAVVCGPHIMHSLVLILLIWLIIKFSNYRYVHAIGFGIGFAYLVFFRATEYFNIPYPTGHANLIHMILTLKVVGLTFEIHDNYETEQKIKSNKETTEVERFRLFPKPSFLDIFHYGFCYPGIATGPYFTFYTFRDMLKYTTKNYKLCVNKAIETIQWVPLYMILFLTASYFFPLSSLTSDQFFKESSILFRLWYMYPTFFIFRMRMYVAFKLSEASCILAGLGMYPSETQPKVGSGPFTNFDHVKIATEKNTKQSFTFVLLGARVIRRFRSMHKEKYFSQCLITVLKSRVEQAEDVSFETVHSVGILKAEFCSTVREATRHWNRSVQYWLATYVYHRCPCKKYRTWATFLVSSLWHGIHAGYYFSLFSVPFYLFIEDTFVKRMVKNDKSLWKRVFLWNVKMLQFSYWGLAFLIKDQNDIMRYGSSVIFFPYIVAFGMLLCTLLFSKI